MRIPIHGSILRPPGVKNGMRFFFQHGDNPWASAHNDWWSFKKIYIYYRQIGNRMLLRLTPDFNHDLYYVQNNPYYGTNDRYGRGQFEYRAKVSMARTVYFNL